MDALLLTNWFASTVTQAGEARDAARSPWNQYQFDNIARRERGEGESASILTGFKSCCSCTLFEAVCRSTLTRTRAVQWYPFTNLWSSCTDTRINSRNLSNYPNLLWCIFDLECLRRQAWNNQKMAGSLASLLVLVTAMKGASSAETTVQYVKHLKTTQQKEAWPKMVYQSVSFNAPPSVCQLCSFCSIE